LEVGVLEADGVVLSEEVNGKMTLMNSGGMG
jgi:hypothetical protein